MDQLNRDHDAPRYFLGIRLSDGTAVVRISSAQVAHFSSALDNQRTCAQLL